MTDLATLMAWKQETLAQLALELMVENAKLVEAAEQLRTDLRDAMKIAREKNK